MSTLSSTSVPPAPVPALTPFLRPWTLPNSQADICQTHDHFAIIYDNPDEQLDFIVPYLRLGIERGEKSIFIYDDNSAETVIAAMERHGIDVAAACASGALSVITKNHAYLKNGNFDPGWMVDFLAQAVDNAKKEGFSAVRASGEMTWALGPAGNAHERLFEYECKLNRFFPAHDMGGICQYNRRKFRAQTLMHVIHTHRRIVIRGEVCENPYYLPPEVLQARSEEMSAAVHRLLESMADNNRLRRHLAEETAALRRSEKLAVAGRIAAVVAHEINNPLEALSNVYCLLQQESLPPSARKYLDILGEELNRISAISQRAIAAFRAADSNGSADFPAADLNTSE